MAPDKLPRGSLKAATAAVLAAASDFGHGGLIAGDAAMLARAALTAAMPAIERAAVRKAAQRIILLADLLNGIACPACHLPRISGPYWERGVYHDEPCRCACGREWTARPYRADDFARAVRKLARGEPLPDLPAKEEPRA